MTNDVLAEARRRLETLRTEVLQLEAFIELGERIARGEAGPIASDALKGVPSPQGRVRTGPSPREVVRAAYEQLSGTGETLSRRALLERLAERGVVMTGDDPAKNLGTILWRNQTLFEHVRGVGYRWTGATHPDVAEDRSGRPG